MTRRSRPALVAGPILGLALLGCEQARPADVVGTTTSTSDIKVAPPRDDQTTAADGKSLLDFPPWEENYMDQSIRLSVRQLQPGEDEMEVTVRYHVEQPDRSLSVMLAAGREEMARIDLSEHGRLDGEFEGKSWVATGGTADVMLAADGTARIAFEGIELVGRRLPTTFEEIGAAGAPGRDQEEIRTVSSGEVTGALEYQCLVSEFTGLLRDGVPAPQEREDPSWDSDFCRTAAAELGIGGALKSS